MLTRNKCFYSQIYRDLFHVMPENKESPNRSRAVSPFQADAKRVTLNTMSDHKNQSSYRARPQSANNNNLVTNKKYTIKEVTRFQGWNNLPQ